MSASPTVDCRKALRQSIATPVRLLLCILAPLCLWLSGCSAGMGSDSASMTTFGVKEAAGRVMGGQQPVSGASILLWMVNTNGSAASSLMTSTVTSDAGGSFVLTGNYSTSACTSTTQVYIIATGGNAGSGNNNSLALMSALGPCLSLTPSTFIQINEVTTVAAVFALQQFLGATQGTTFAEGIATGSTQQSVQGMINAFQTAQLLANVSTGSANATVGGAGIEVSKINSLANIIAACVNSSGSSSTACQSLFADATPSNSPSPVDTIQALLYIAGNPGNNVSSLFALSSATPPFAPALTAAPFDWTIGVTYTGDGLNLPYLLAADETGNIWVAGEKSSAEALVELTPSGAPASGSPFLVNQIDLPQAVLPDTLGKIWMTANGSNSSTGNRLFSFNPSTANTTEYTLPTGCAPASMAIDGSDDLFFACNSLGYLYELPNQTSGTPSATNLPSYPASPTQLGAVGTQNSGMAIDGLGNVWVANTKTSSSPAVTEYAAGSYGTVANTFSLSTTGPVSIAIDHSNNAWAPSGTSLVEYAYASGAAYTTKTFSGGGLNNGQYVAVDGAGNLWIANGGVTTLSGVTYVSISEFNGSGVALSPAAVSGTAPGGFSHGSSATTPVPRGITIDPSGNVWMTGCALSSSCANSTSFVLEIVGAASPPVVPLASAIASSQLGCCSFIPTPPSPSSLSARPTINSFAATSTSVTAGQPITLTWSVSNATSTQISGVAAFPVSPITVYPDASGSYTLTASNINGSVSQSISVSVTTTQIASATIASTPGQLVPANFMGLGIGPTSWESAFGEPATGTNTVLRQIISNITQYGASPISYKITAYDQYPSSTATYVPTATQVSALNQLYADNGTTFYVGVNLVADVPSIAEAQTQAYASLMTPGSLVGIEIGNEPDNYPPVSERPNPYYFLEDYATIEPGVLTSLQAYQPSTVKIVGPAWGEPKSLTGGIGNVVNDSGSAIKIGDYLSQEGSNLSLVTQHAYTDQCTSLNRTTPPSDYLLQAAAQNCASSSYLFAGVAPTHALGLKYRIGETNSITGGGLSGISNTYQASLWIADFCARLAQGGVDGVNIFGDSKTQYYTMFTFNQATTGTQTAYTLNYVLPQYYGVLLFQQATQNKAQFLPVTTSATGNQVIYGWLDASNTIRVLILNKDEAGSGTVSLTLPTGYGDGTITRLVESVPNASPAYLSTNGVTLGGQSFDASVLGTEAANGVIQGNAYSEVVVPSSNVYTFAMPVTSAVLLTVPHF